MAFIMLIGTLNLAQQIIYRLGQSLAPPMTISGPKNRVQKNRPEGRRKFLMVDMWSGLLEVGVFIFKAFEYYGKHESEQSEHENITPRQHAFHCPALSQHIAENK